MQTIMGLGKVTRGSVRVTDVGSDHGVFLAVWKEKRFACRSMRDKQSYRLIYSFNGQILVLIDIYCKNNQEKHDIDLIRKTMSGIKDTTVLLDDPFIEIKDNKCRNLYINDHDED